MSRSKIQRALAMGVQVNTKVYWSGTVRAIRQMPPVKSLVERRGIAVGRQRVEYRLKLLGMPVGETGGTCQPLRRAFLKKMGLPLGTATAATDSFVWLAEQDELAVDRVRTLARLLGEGGTNKDSRRSNEGDAAVCGVQ